MAKTPYQKLQTKRNTCLNAIKHHKEKSDKVTNSTTQNELLSRIVQLESAFDRFQEVQKQLLELDEYDEKDFPVTDEDITELFITASAKLKDASKDDGPSLNSTSHACSTSPSQSQAQTTCNEVKLGKVNIRKFNGDYEHWTTFYDSFLTYVDQNSNYSDVSKLYYLRDSLTGTALAVINRLPITESNYKIAWKLLKDRFHNKRAITNYCLSNVFNHQKVSQASAKQLRELIDTIRDSFQTLETIEIAIDSWDAILVYIVESKLNSTIKFEWERHLNGSKEIPSYQDMHDFLETQHRIFETSEKQLIIEAPHSNDVKKVSKHFVPPVKTFAINSERCCVCNEGHWVFFCPTFDNWLVKERIQFIRDSKRCENCFKSHSMDQCKSKYRCRKCGGFHNTKLHEDTVVSTVIGNEFEQESVSPVHITAINLEQNTFKILATALVRVTDKFGLSHIFRAFIDQGAESPFITERAVQQLCLSSHREHIPLLGMNDVSLGRATKSVKIEIRSNSDPSFIVITKALVSKTIITTRNFNNKTLMNCNHLKGIPLADPNFSSNENIDLLLGVDIYALSLRDGIRKGEPNQPVAQNSRFGWLVFGASNPIENSPIRVHYTSLSKELQRFWQNEEVEMKPIMSEEHEKCKEFYESTTKRQPNGRFIVSLPYTMDCEQHNFLGNTYEIALRRQLCLEKRLRSNPKLREMYNDFMLEYLTLQHMSLYENDNRTGCYLPHHAVLRESSTTTKLRTVFDASAKSANGFSLNDRLLNGPTIQPELFDIFIRWRINKIALVADVEKMYRQIDVAPADRINQKILYRFSENEPIRTYILNTITYGMKSAPYMAIQTTFKLADEEAKNYPLASHRVKTDMYVDDVLSGADTPIEAIELRRQFSDLFSAGHMTLRKWASNDESVLTDIPVTNRALHTPFELHMNDDIKTLGVWWNPQTDKLYFKFDISTLSSDPVITKRKLLSDASKLYDLFGILSPITIKAKILMQDVWKQGIDWDSNLSPELQSQWNEYRSELHLLEKVEISRWLSTTKEAKVSLHGFCDSSSKAYCAIIYIVQRSDAIITSNIVCAKTKVAPIQCESIPRLELCGAFMLHELMKRVARNLNVAKEHIHLWTDSEVVLTWLHGHPSNWVTYIANRVSKIQKEYNISYWRYVPTHENPADIGSRGVLASQLVGNLLWMHGPKWLLLNESEWPQIKWSLSKNFNPTFN